MARIDLDYELKPGQVRVVSSNNGKKIDSIEIILDDQVKACMDIDFDLNLVNFIVHDTDLADLPSLNCQMSKETVKDLIIGFNKLYSELE